MFSTSSKNLKNCAGQIKQTCKLYAVHDLWVCVLCPKMRTSCFCLFWSIEVRLGIPHQQAKGYTRNTFPSPAISQMLWVENGKPGTDSRWLQASWLVREAHQRPPPNPPPPHDCQQADFLLQAAPHSWQRMARQMGIETLAKAGFLILKVSFSPWGCQI